MKKSEVWKEGGTLAHIDGIWRRVTLFTCPGCGLNTLEPLNYCPNCGKRRKGGTDESEKG